MTIIKTLKYAPKAEATLWLAIPIFFACLFVNMLLRPAIEFDTRRLAAGIPALKSCLTSGIQCQEVSYFPPLQHLIALIYSVAGLEDEYLGKALLWTGSIFSYGSVIWIFVFCRTKFDNANRTQILPWIALILLSGPLIPYYGSSFTEMMVTSSLCLLALTTLRSSSIWMFFLALLVTLSKDTAAPAVLLFVLSCWLLSRNRSVKTLLAPGAGIIIGTLIGVGFNFLRYDSFVNTFHLDPVFMSGSLAQSTQQFAAAVISPNAGLLFFSPAALGLIVFGVAARRRFFTSAEKTGFVLVLALLFMHYAGISFFYSPFGWISWGNRLSLPWLTGGMFLITILISRYPVSVHLAAGRRLTIAVAAGILNLPHLLATTDRAVIFSVFKPNEICPRLADVMVEKSYYTICLNSYFWPETSVLADSFFIARPDFIGWGLIISGSLVTTAAAWLLLQPPPESL